MKPLNRRRGRYLLRSLRQGDYLPHCLVPVFGTELSTPGTHQISADEYDLIVLTQSCDLARLGAEFVAAVQIIVYGGAIMVLFVFVIMLLNASPEEHTDFSKLAKYGGLPLALALTGLLAAAMIQHGGATGNAGGTDITLASTTKISEMLFSTFVYPFELTSFLILIAIMGALVLAQREKKS